MLHLNVSNDLLEVFDVLSFISIFDCLINAGITCVAQFTNSHCSVLMLLLLLLLPLLEARKGGGYRDPPCMGNRTVLLELYGWHYTDIANECEEHLGPAGYCAVQILPANELRQPIGDR